MRGEWLYYAIAVAFNITVTFTFYCYDSLNVCIDSYIVVVVIVVGSSKTRLNESTWVIG